MILLLTFVAYNLPIKLKGEPVFVLSRAIVPCRRFIPPQIPPSLKVTCAGALPFKQVPSPPSSPVHCKQKCDPFCSLPVDKLFSHGRLVQFSPCEASLLQHQFEQNSPSESQSKSRYVLGVEIDSLVMG